MSATSKEVRSHDSLIIFQAEFRLKKTTAPTIVTARLMRWGSFSKFLRESSRVSDSPVLGKTTIGRSVESLVIERVPDVEVIDPDSICCNEPEPTSSGLPGKAGFGLRSDRPIGFDSKNSVDKILAVHAIFIRDSPRVA